MISLNANSKNTKNFRNWCSRHEKTYEVIPGVRVENWKDYKRQLCPYAYYLMYNWRPSSHHFDTTGPIGCFLAHRNAWSICVQKQENIWIFEEGVYSYNDDVFEKLNTFKHVDLILGHTIFVPNIKKQRCIRHEYNKNNKITPDGLSHIDKVYYGTKCYNISPRFAQLLIDHSKQIDTQVDTYLCIMAIYYDDSFNVFRSTSTLVGAASSGTINHSMDYSVLIPYVLLFIIFIIFIMKVIIYKKFKKCENTLNKHKL